MVPVPNRRRLDYINDLWDEDSQPFNTDPDKLPGEASRIFSVISKYDRIRADEIRALSKLSTAAETLRFRLMRLYRDGPLSQEEQRTVIEQGWELPPEGKCAVKTDVKHWVETNPAMVEMTLELAEQNEIIDLLDRIHWTLKEKAKAINETMRQVRFNGGSR